MAARLEDIATKKANFQPGPGNYDLQNGRNLNHNRTQLYSFGKEGREHDTHMKEQKGKPGSGTYNQDFQPLLVKAPKYRFGSSDRKDLK